MRRFERQTNCQHFHIVQFVTAGGRDWGLAMGATARSMRVSMLLAGLAVSTIYLAIPQTVSATTSAGSTVAATISHDERSIWSRAFARSWFGGSLSLVSHQTLSSRYFDGNNVGIEMTASCPVDGMFSVSLLRSGSLVGSATFKRNGFTKATWEGVGPGYYQFSFSKANDGAWVTSGDVAMYSW